MLAEVRRAAPELQHKAGLYRRGGVVGVLRGTADKPWLTKLMNMVLKQTPDQQRTQPQQALLACQPDTETQVEEEGLSEDSLPEQPVLWELWVPDPQTGEQLCVLRSDDSDASEACALCKSEPVYTPNVELLLDGLQEPLQVVHTVDPRDAENCIEKWVPSIHKEIGVIEKAVLRLPPAEVRSGGWLRRKEVKVVPSKFVFTVKPPDPAEGEAFHASRKGQAYHKRKARLVACGSHAPGTASQVYASGPPAETLRCFIIISSKRPWCIGSLDVTSAFLLTPIPQGRGFPVFALTPPRLLVTRFGRGRGALDPHTRCVRFEGVAEAVVRLQGLPTASVEVCR